MSKLKITSLDVCIIFLLLCYPIVITKSYEDIVSAKYIVFMACAVFIICLFISNYVFSFVRKYNRNNENSKNDLRKIPNILCQSMTDVAMIIFGMLLLCSFCISEYKEISFWGSQYDKMGVIYYLVLILLYFALSRTAISKKMIIISTSIGFCVVVFTATLQFMGVDIFDLLCHLRHDIRINYLSFLGNTNIFSSYLCLFTPVYMMGAVISDKHLHQILFQIMSFIGFFGLFIANSDGGYAGFFIALTIIIYLTAGSRNRLRRFIYLLINYCCCSIIFYIIHSLLSDYARPISKLTRSMTYGNFTRIMIFILIIALILINNIKAKPEVFIYCRKITRLIIVIFISLMFILVIYVNYIDNSVDLGDFDKYLKFSKDWGTGRGYVWSWCFEIFNNSSIINQLFGNGLSTTGTLLIADYESFMKNSLGYYFYSAHNEYIEMLINIGIFGLLSYISLILTSIIGNIKQFDSFRIMFVCGIIAYSVQSSFIVMQPVVFPLLFVFIAFANNKQLID